MMTSKTLILAAAVMALALTACTTTRTVVAPEPATTPAAAAAASSAPTGISCADISGDLSTVVSDLKTMGAKEQEAWVSGGDSADLQALISDTANAASGG